MIFRYIAVCDLSLTVKPLGRFLLLFYTRKKCTYVTKKSREEGEDQKRDGKEREEEDKIIQEWKDKETLRISLDNGSAEEKAGGISAHTTNAKEGASSTENPKNVVKQEYVVQQKNGVFNEKRLRKGY